ncbi:enoyl-CoA hydratase/isomerase [Alteromonas sp. a30]|nr:enoyl-CoA hydratase/isomerase [Alteromonas sp. a30]
MAFQTIRVQIDNPICTIQLYRPEANNTINGTMLQELTQLLTALQATECTVVVLEGLPEVFCFGADFGAMAESHQSHGEVENDPEFLYNLWLLLATGPFMTIAHVRGKVNAGGVGFVSACDLVIADTTVTFSLSELLFGLIPACVMPFLVRKVGTQKAHYLTVTTQTISAEKATEWGLVDDLGEKSKPLLRKHLMRLRRMSKKTITRYKRFISEINPILTTAKNTSLSMNAEVFSDQDNLNAIRRYVEEGIFPWEKKC